MQTLIFAILVSLALSIIAGYIIIPMLRKLKLGQQVRDDGPQSHLKKAGTPSMGGLIFLVSLTVTTALFSSDDYRYTIFMLAVTIGFALVGFLDDFIKVKMRRSLGLKAYQKMIGQLGLAAIVAIFAYNDPNIGPSLYIPFFNVEWDLGVFYIPFTMFVVVAMVNAVNLTDGLDGLAAGVSFIDAAAFSVIFFALSVYASNSGLALAAANYKNTMVFAASLAGALLGFLRFNSYPAKVFMGDTGSLALGAALTLMGVVSRFQLLLPVMGVMFVASVVSVILQVGSYKLRHGKRVFKMAPLHHHFELKGVHETKIVTVYMLITLVMCLLCALFVSF